MRATVVIPSFNARELLVDALESLTRQTHKPSVVVVDNASSDGSAEMVRQRFPGVRVLRNETNLGFGRAVNRAASSIDGDVLILVNNDVVCEEHFVERMLTPFVNRQVGMAAGVLLQWDDPDRIDSAGIEIDPTLRAWDFLWNEPASVLDHETREPLGPCGGAAAYRLDAFLEVGGFDEAFFAYWEDVDLAIRLRLAGWASAFVRNARALHRHGATVSAGSNFASTLNAFGRGYMLAKYEVTAQLGRAAAVALLDWPAIAAHLILRQDGGVLRARREGVRTGRVARRDMRAARPPFPLATVSLIDSFRRALRLYVSYLRGCLPAYYTSAQADEARFRSS